MAIRNIVRLSEAEAERLTKFYEQAEREILDRMNRALLRGNKTEYLAGMKKNVEAILADLRAGSRKWCEEAIPRVYVQGASSADIMIKAQGQSIVGGFGAIHQQAAQVLAENTFQRLNDVTQLIGRRVEGLYRDMALENVRGSVVGYDTWKQVARRYREQLAEHGVTGFKDSANRNWNMRAYAEMVARTSTMEAHLQGTANRLVEQGHDLVKVSTHTGACKLCQPWQGKILSITGKTEGYPTLEEANAAGLFHPNCFPAGVLVSGPAPLAAFARWYEGKIVIITTASGVELPVTPNHPILTPKGWIAAGLLNEGDNIIRYTGQKGMMDSIDPDYQDVPTPIEQVTDAFGKSSSVSARSMPISSEDFHGDGVGSEVYVVWANGLLMNDRYAFFNEPSSKYTFSFANVGTFFLHSLGPIAQLLERTLATARCFISGLSQSLPFFRSHSAKTDFHCFRTVLGCGDAKVCKALLNSGLVDPKTFSNSLFSFASEIPAQNILTIQRDAAVHSCFGKIANRDTVFFEDGFNGLFADVEGGRKLIERLAGSITTDKVVSIKFNTFSGHVYNLQTVDGWYIANSIITHNCRHAYGLHIDLDKEIEETEQELFKKAGKSDIIKEKVDAFIDAQTPCLVERATGKILKTAYAPVKINDVKNLKQKGWNFNWVSPIRKGYNVYGLTLADNKELQGLIAMKPSEEHLAIQVSIVESAPHNVGSRGRYEGVGAHLFAIVAQKSFEYGYNGYVYFEAKTKLIEHYKKELGAVQVGNSQRMYINTQTAKALVDKYLLGGEGNAK